MAAIAFSAHAKTHTTTTGHTYSYLSIPPAAPNKPTLLFLHGFPSSIYDFRAQIAYFSSPAVGYGILAPDLLGYGATDRPAAVAAYAGKAMAGEITEILRTEGYWAGGDSGSGTKKKVHAVAHDWGTLLLGRLCNWYPGIFRSVSFLAVGYTPPGIRIDVDALNAMTKKMQGWEIFGYWKFFGGPDAGDIVRDHFDSFYSLLYAADPNDWKEHLAPLGALEEWLKEDKKATLGSYITEQDKETYRKIMASNFGPSMNWFRSAMSTNNYEDEIGASPPLDPKLHIPTLYIESAHDPVSSGPRAVGTMKMLVDDLKVESLDAGHWVQLEKADEVNRILQGFVEGAGD